MIQLEKMEYYLEMMTKDDLAKLANLEEKEIRKVKKDELVRLAKKKVGNSKKTKLELIETHPLLFSIRPSQIEEMFNITTTERKRWTEEKKFLVVGYDSFHKWGKTIEYPLYGLHSVVKITDKKIEQWRAEHKNNTSKNRKKAAIKAIVTRKKNHSIQRAFYEDEWVAILKKWDNVDRCLSATLQLAYWTVWVSRWAKENQLRSINAKSKKMEYSDKKESYYELKNEAIRLLNTSPFASLSFYEPESPHKIANLNFCKEHYEDWCEIREWDYVPKWDYFYSKEKMIRKCPSCEFDEIRHFYSLYYLAISDNRLPDYTFSFHAPYPIGSDFLPNKNTLPKVIHQEQEGLFRFGRSLSDVEQIIFTERETLKQFELAKKRFNDVMSCEVVL